MVAQLFRQSHRYAGLFLAPWLLMYALSTLVMNHDVFFITRHGRGPPPFEKERELIYAGTFAGGAAPRDMARQILLALDLDGSHNVTRRPDGALVINRQDLLSPRRLTYTPADHKLLIERQTPRTNVMLERFHRRRGYATGYALDTAWAVTVDLTIAGIIVWVVSGVWLWWGMKETRLPGALAAATGAAFFIVCIFTI
jgi:hypothetical protein